MEDEKIEKSIEDSEYIYVMSNIYKSTDDCSFKERGKEELRRLINDKRKERRDKGNYRYIP